MMKKSAPLANARIVNLWILVLVYPTQRIDDNKIQNENELEIFNECLYLYNTNKDLLLCLLCSHAGTCVLHVSGLRVS